MHKLLVIYFVISVVILEYFVGRGNFRTMIAELRSNEVYGKFGRILLKTTVIPHELAHLLAVIIFECFYVLTFWIPGSKLWYAKFESISFDIDGDKLGEVKFKGGVIARFFVSIMPLGLIYLAFIGFITWVHLPLAWRISAAIPFFGLIFIPCILGCLPSEEDLLVNSVIVPIPFIGYLGYLLFHPEAIKLIAWGLLSLHLSFIAVIILEFIILFYPVLHWVNNNTKKISFSWWKNYF